MKMDASTERAYKRKCFQGRGPAARWLDRLFFSIICGAAMYILTGRRSFALLLFGAALLTLTFLDIRQWDRFRRKLRHAAVKELRREAWLKGEADRIRQGGGTVLFPAPDRDALVGFCLRLGPGASFHSFGDTKAELCETAQAFGRTLIFHPWGEGEEPSSEQVENRLKQNAPMRSSIPWRRLLALPGSRYLLTGCLMLLLSVFLRRALYWRLLGTLCLLVGTVRRSFRLTAET